MKNLAFFFAACLLMGFFIYSSSCSFPNDEQRFKVGEKFASDSLLYVQLTDSAFNTTSGRGKFIYAEKAMVIAETYQRPKWQAAVKMYLGDGHFKMGNLVKSIESYIQAVKFYEEVDSELGISTAYSNVGNIYDAQGDYSNAIRYYSKAIVTFRSVNDSLRLATTLLNAGDSYMKNDQFDSAKLYFRESSILFDALGSPKGTAYNLGQIALIYAEMGLFERVELNMTRAVQVLSEINDHFAIATFHVTLADIFLKRGFTDKSLMAALKAYDIGKMEGLKGPIRDASLILSEVHKGANNTEKAYEYLNEYVIYRDSINSEKTIQEIADLRTDFEVSQKQAELNLKQAEVTLLNEQAQSNKIVLWAVLIILLLLLCLTYALLKIYRIKDRAVRIVRQRGKVVAGQRNALAMANETKNKFFSIVSHDIRGPVNNFHGVAQLIKLLVEDDDKKGLLALGAMLDSSTKELSALLDNLLEWAMSEQGKIPYQAEEVKLHEVCNSNLSILHNLASAKRINLTHEVKERAFIHADKNSVSTIIRNLLSNAIKFTPEHGEIILSIQQEGDRAVVMIRDTGIGIPKDKLQTLYNFKGQRSRWGTKGEKGMGLGLILVHEFVQMNKGKIVVDSEEGKGTVFKVYLPLFE